MKKKIFSVMLFFTMMISGLIPVYGFESPDLGISGQSAIMIDQDSGQVIYDKNANNRIYPASITKIVTCITAIEMIKDFNATTTITDDDIATVWETGASAANFMPGEVVTYRDLIMGAMLPSGADATRALANNTCGNQEKFVEKMNQLASKLGCKDTHFVNTTGIHDDNHYTTVADMALLTQYALKNEDFKEAFNRYQYTSSNSQHSWVKKNIRNAKIRGVDTTMIEGCKSGFTDEAQHTLSSLLNINDHHYICVVAHCQNSPTYGNCAVNDTLTLANYVGSHYQYVELHKQGDHLANKKVTQGKQKTLKVVAPESIGAIVPTGYNEKDIKEKVSIKTLKAPLKKGDVIGTMTITYQNEQLSTINLISQQTIKKVKPKPQAHVSSILMPYGLAVVLIIVYIIIFKIKPKK